MTDSFYKTNLQFNHNGKHGKHALVIKDSYRVSVFRSRLFRIEYDPDGQFEDRPTQTFWHRNINESFTVNENKDVYTIITNHLQITLDSNQPGLSGLVVSSLDGTLTCKAGQKDKQNLLGTYRTLDMVNGTVKLDKGLLSRSGITMYDDASSVVFKDGEIIGENQNKSDLYVFGYGQDYTQCIKDFYLISGNTPLIPKYVFGNWWSRYWNYSEDDIKTLMQTFKDNDIPLSVCIIDMDWHITDVPDELGGGWTGYTWNRDLFPHHQELLTWLHRQNLKVSLNLHPADGIRPYDDCYKAVCKRMGIDPLEKKIIPFDITNPTFTEAYFKDIHLPLEKDGVDFWWIDWQQGTKTKMNNLDPLFALNHYHFIDGLNRHSQGYFIFSRWSKLGSHRYPIGFSGDTFSTWKSLDFQPYFTSTATNVGYGWWSHDIGGHQGGIQDGELYTRWVQLGIFSPVNRLHSTKSHYQKREPWRFDTEVETTVTHALQLRHKLIPYIHTFNHLHAQGELPLIRPMYYDYPDTIQAYKHKNQYMFGTELLVRPFTSKTIGKLDLAKTKVWIPDGNYFHFFSGDHIVHQGTYTVYGCKRDIPVFAKAGAIVPLATSHKHGLDDLPKELTVHLFPGSDNRFTLIEDKDGVVYHTTFTLNYTQNKMTVVISGDSPTTINRILHLRFRSVEINATVLSDLDISSTTDDDTNSLIITVPFNMKDNLTVTIESNDSILKDPYNFESDIMNSIDISRLKTEEKNTIGYLDSRKPNESRGWISWDKPLKDKLDDISNLDIPKYAKTFLRKTLQNKLKNDE